MVTCHIRPILFLLPFALAQPLSAEGEEFVDEVVHRADHAGVAAVVGRGDDQIDEVLADVGVGEFERPGPQGSGAFSPGRFVLRLARREAFAEVVAPHGEQAVGIGEPRQDELPQDADDPVVVRAVDAALDLQLRQFAFLRKSCGE